MIFRIFTLIPRASGRIFSHASTFTAFTSATIIQLIMRFALGIVPSLPGLSRGTLLQLLYAAATFFAMRAAAPERRCSTLVIQTNSGERFRACKFGATCLFVQLILRHLNSFGTVAFQV